MIGVPLVTFAWTVKLPANTLCVVTGPSCTSTASVIRPDSSLIASRPAISLPSNGGRDQDRGGRGLLGQLLQRLGLRGHQVALDLGVVDDVDLLGAVLLHLLGRVGGLVGRADEDRGGLAETLGDGEELVRRLADRAVDVVDQNQNFRHAAVAPQMNFLEARNSVSAVAPEPSSSLTISPAVRGGRAVVSSTSVHATDRPTSPASTPRSLERPGLQRLLLGRHDALERRVAGLAGLVGDREHQRHGAADDLGRGVAVALDPDLVALGLDHRGERDLRQAEALGEHRRHDARRTRRSRPCRTRRGRPACSAPIFSIGLGQHQRGGDVVGAGDRLVGDVDALVGAHLQRLADGVDGLLGADAQAR